MTRVWAGEQFSRPGFDARVSGRAKDHQMQLRNLPDNWRRRRVVELGEFGIELTRLRRQQASNDWTAG